MKEGCELFPGFCPGTDFFPGVCIYGVFKGEGESCPANRRTCLESAICLKPGSARRQVGTERVAN